MIIDAMRSELCRVGQAFQPHDLKLIIGGGYGLMLRNEHLQKHNFRTRFEEIPLSRSTNDFDVFLSAEIISDAAKLAKFRDVLRELITERSDNCRASKPRKVCPRNTLKTLK